MFLSDLCKESTYCKTVALKSCGYLLLGLLLLLWANLENISRILIFADLDLGRNSAKIGRREFFPFYVFYDKVKFGNLGFSKGKSENSGFFRNYCNQRPVTVGRCRQLIEFMKECEY